MDSADQMLLFRVVQPGIGYSTYVLIFDVNGSLLGFHKPPEFSQAGPKQVHRSDLAAQVDHGMLRRGWIA